MSINQFRRGFLMTVALGCLWGIFWTISEHSHSVSSEKDSLFLLFPLFLSGLAMSVHKLFTWRELP